MYALFVCGNNEFLYMILCARIDISLFFCVDWSRKCFWSRNMEDEVKCKLRVKYIKNIKLSYLFETIFYTDLYWLSQCIFNRNATMKLVLIVLLIAKSSLDYLV